MLIRTEEPGDYPAVYAVNASAFKTPAEANLVEVLRTDAATVISLVAVDKGEVVGHIFFSPVTLSGHAELKIMGLGPMAVMHAHRRKGIGSALVRTGLDKCSEAGFGAVVVLGHTWFYPRFGFIPSVRFGIHSEYIVPEDVFMALELQPGYLRGTTGNISYQPAFKNV
jgi:putative acetyltransferase